jgi:hypothetical protein
MRAAERSEAANYRLATITVTVAYKNIAYSHVSANLKFSYFDIIAIFQ